MITKEDYTRLFNALALAFGCIPAVAGLGWIGSLLIVLLAALYLWKEYSEE